MTAVVLVFLFLFMLVGIPVCWAIALAGTTYIQFFSAKPMLIVAQRIYTGMDSFTLIAIPLFMLMGNIMCETSLAKRLTRWVEMLFSNVAGGMGAVCIVSCALFAALTGSGPATVAAIGTIMIPIMVRNGYTIESATGITATGGALGPIIPPSINQIVYGSLMGVSIPKMFAGSIAPGLLITGALLATNHIMAKRSGVQRLNAHRNSKEILKQTFSTLPVLVIPVMILGGIYGGICTPTEAATIGCVYCLILGLLYRELSWKAFRKAMEASVLGTGVCLILTAGAMVFGYVLAYTRLPSKLATALLPFLSSKLVYLMVLLLILLVFGCFMETLATIYILAPIIIPLGIQLGCDEIHLAVMFCVVLTVGFVTPPFGANLFVASGVAKISYERVVKGVIPYMIAALVCTLLITFWEPLITWLPSFI